MAFQKYMLEELQRQSPKGKPIISITSACSICFSKNLTQKHDLQGKHVLLFYDKQLKKIGIKFLSSSNECSIEIKSISNSSYILCSKFFTYFSIRKINVGRNTYKQLIEIDLLVDSDEMIILNYPNRELLL